VIDLVVYTVLTGNKEALGDPLRRLTSKDTDLRIDFVCLTDNEDLKSPTWRVTTFDTLRLLPEKASRMPKALPHAFFANYARFSLYVDNTVEFRRLPTSQDLWTQAPYLFKLYKHHGRATIIEEAAAIASLGYDSSSNLIRQLEHYSKYIDLHKITPLSTCTIMFRDHSNSQVSKHGELWWAHILAFSQRDQMSFDFARLQTQTQVEYLAGDKHNNDLVFAQDNFSSSRVLAHFDDKRYAWLHRGDQAAIANPRRHFIESRSAEPRTSRRYINRQGDPLDLYFYLFRCSFGSFHSPRRNMSHEMHRFLSGIISKGSKGGLLHAFFPHLDHEESVSLKDFDALCKALASFYSLELKEFSGATADFVDALTVDVQTPCDVRLLVFGNVKDADHLTELIQPLLRVKANLQYVALVIFSSCLSSKENGQIASSLSALNALGLETFCPLSSSHDSFDRALNLQVFGLLGQTGG
jgi:hypothetical protein